MKIIVGLGNPGKKYQTTRHNVGFQALDFIFAEKKIDWNFANWQTDKKFQAQICEGNFHEQKIILLKPQTFMNASGNAVQAIFHYYKIAPLDLLVIHDDLDLAFGKIKIQKNISSAGHKGIKSIIEKINTQDFWRIRVGIGKEKKSHQGETSNFVLNNFGLFEKLKLKNLKKQILEEIEKLL